MMGDVEGDPAAVGEGSFQNGAGGETRMSQERGRSCSEHRRQWREECVCVCVYVCMCVYNWSSEMFWGVTGKTDSCSPSRLSVPSSSRPQTCCSIRGRNRGR